MTIPEAQEKMLQILAKALATWAQECPCSCKGCDALRAAVPEAIAVGNQAQPVTGRKVNNTKC